MTDETPAPKTRKAPMMRPAETDPATDATTDAAPAAPAEVHESAPAVRAEAEPATANEEAAPATATGEVTPAAAESAVAGQQVVYVQAPIPPRVRGNRVVGVLLALLGTVVFALVYAAAAAIPLAIRFNGAGFSPAFSAFVQNAIFWIPVMMFALGFVLLTLILNRAGWWAHVIGSLLVAVFVYFASIGLLLLINNVFGQTPAQANSAFGALATNPLIIAAALVAREVSIWIGLAIAARGRRVKARNIETRTEWDREQEEKKAEYERAGSTPAA
ncbi:MAG: hypothetical protein ABIS08_00010 [Pseudolysinimonas sp.]